MLSFELPLHNMQIMYLRVLFIIYIAFLSAFDGLLDQDSHKIVQNKEISAQIEDSKDALMSMSQVTKPQQKQNNDSDCPDPENCHDCHQCMGHCGFIFNAEIKFPPIFTESTFSTYVKTLVSRDFNSLFRPPILS